MTVYQPDGSLISPIITALANIIRNQIAGVAYVYEQIPDIAPEDNTALVPLSKFQVMGDTNGKLYLKFTFGIRHMLTRAEMSDNLITAYSYLPAYLKAFSAWGNQSLGGLAQSISPSSGGVSQWIENGQSYVALIVNVDVLTEYNIPTS